jgi:hypothetical protein
MERWLAPYEGRASLVLNNELRVTMVRAAWQASLRIASDWRIWLEAAHTERRRPLVDEHWLARLGRWDASTALPIGMALKKLPDCLDEMYLYLC